MLNINNITKIGFTLIVAWVTVSCNAQKKYQRPEEVSQDIVYRTDELSTDSISIATNLGERFLQIPHYKDI